MNGNDKRVAASDYNVSWKPAGRLTVSGGPADGSLAKWLTVLDPKFDQHSVVADPMFDEPWRRNHHVRSGSPP